MSIAAVLEILVPAAALAGLAAVALEILVKDPKALVEIVTDVRAMARPTVAAGAARPANSNAHGDARAA
ncbi:hypothetical protein [Azospirillum sp. ST 5-10]|uniref:hypothetical protein n=1 Tax=unclassified Azospirillum TaxID=2630922 RepID=UPI003F4A188C